jgi:hypothetical protein
MFSQKEFKKRITKKNRKKIIHFVFWILGEGFRKKIFGKGFEKDLEKDLEKGG